MLSPNLFKTVVQQLARANSQPMCSTIMFNEFVHKNCSTRLVNQCVHTMCSNEFFNISVQQHGPNKTFKEFVQTSRSTTVSKQKRSNKFVREHLFKTNCLGARNKALPHVLRENHGVGHFGNGTSMIDERTSDNVPNSLDLLGRKTNIGLCVQRFPNPHASCPHGHLHKPTQSPGDLEAWLLHQLPMMHLWFLKVSLRIQKPLFNRRTQLLMRRYHGLSSSHGSVWKKLRHSTHGCTLSGFSVTISQLGSSSMCLATCMTSKRLAPKLATAKNASAGSGATKSRR